MKKQCTKCREWKPKTDFYSSKRDGLQSHCKSCIRERISNRYRRLIQNPIFKKKELIRLRQWKKNNIQQVKATSRKWYQRIRSEALRAYGGKNPKCKCCGETAQLFLTIDHINGGGNKHRRLLKSEGRGSNFFLWLKRKKYPKGFQLLCYNCNCAKSFYGKCPHKLINKL